MAQHLCSEEMEYNLQILRNIIVAARMFKKRGKILWYEDGRPVQIWECNEAIIALQEQAKR